MGRATQTNGDPNHLMAAPLRQEWQIIARRLLSMDQEPRSLVTQTSLGHDMQGEVLCQVMCVRACHSQADRPCCVC